MKRLASALALVACLVSAAATARASDGDRARDERRAFAAMHYLTGTQKLPGSHGTYAVPAGAKMVTGADAERADELVNAISSSSVEGIVFLPHRLLYLAYVDSGFVTADDWKDVDADKMLAQMKDGQSQENDERVKNGAKPFYVDGWAQRPVFDPVRKSVRYVITLHGDGGRFVNAVALQLGRRGYERFTLASDGRDPSADAAILARATSVYTFDRGFRFSDYVQGDKVAGFGIAALVGTAAGATIAKTVGFGAVLLLIKKFFILIVAGCAALLGRIKRFFKRDRTTFGPPRVPVTTGEPPAPSP